MSKIVAKAPHRIGRTQVFLPNFTLTLLRTPALPPTFASFYVPLNLNKLDLRDYLWNAYSVRALSVRSYVQMQKLRQDKPSARRPAPRRWFRPRSIKKMTVEMEQPFVWPEVPKSFEKWDKKTYDAAQKDREESSETLTREYKQKPSGDRESIAKEAKELLNGASWRSGQVNVWEDVGEEVEVEQDVELPPMDDFKQLSNESVKSRPLEK